MFFLLHWGFKGSLKKFKEINEIQKLFQVGFVKIYFDKIKGKNIFVLSVSKALLEGVN